MDKHGTILSLMIILIGMGSFVVMSHHSSPTTAKDQDYVRLLESQNLALSGMTAQLKAVEQQQIELAREVKKLVEVIEGQSK